MRHALMLLALTASALVHGQHSLASSTGSNPILVEPHATRSASKSPRIEPFAGNQTPIAPAQFTVSAFARGLASPRNLIVLKNGDVLVAEAKTEKKYDDPNFRDAGANRITLLRDRNKDGLAEFRTVLISGLRQPYGMQVVGKRLYVADTDGVYWMPFRVGQTRISEDIKKTWITRFQPGGYNNHWTRNLIASPDGRALYVAVGSASNVGEFGMAAEERRAAILKIDLTSGRESIFASGLRNPVGMDFEPTGGKLWTVVNERDGLGDDLVPDYTTNVIEGGFYGWPYSYFGQHPDPRRKGERADLVSRALVPDFATGAHTASLGILFTNHLKMPTPFRSGAFVARHGSWNRSVPAGYDVVFIPFAHGKPSGEMKPFLTGFLRNENEAAGRPRALAAAADGSLLVADDAGDAIWRIAVDSRSQMHCVFEVTPKVIKKRPANLADMSENVTYQ